MKSILKRLKMDQKSWVIISIFLIIFSSGIVLRSYNFSNWLHFELDQSRDVMFVSAGITEGISHLPILGPKAGGTLLRLGPIYYYFEYISAKIFGNNPSGHAVFILLFSVFSIPAFYFLMRYYFTRNISLMLLAIYSSSLFFILYSRFAWNPNIIPFFAFIGALAILKATGQKTSRPGRWFLLAALSFSIATQLHFIAFLSLPPIVILYLIYKRPNFSWKVWLSAILIFLFLYSPVILNDVLLKGTNWKEFVNAFSIKSEDHSLAAKVLKNISEQTEGYALLLSGNDQLAIPKLMPSESFYRFSCTDSCKSTFPIGFTASLFFIVGLIILLYRTYKENPGTKKDFLVFMTIWFAVVFVLFTPLAFKMYPRFFLLLAFMPFVFLGLIFERTGIEKKKMVFFLALAITIFLIISNTKYVFERFDQLAKAKSESVRIPTDNILREKARVTLEQENLIVDYMQDKHKNNGYPIYLYSEPFYRRSFGYLVQSRNIYIAQLDASSVYIYGNHFVILRTRNLKSKVMEKYKKSYDIMETVPFGTLTVLYLAPKAEKITSYEKKESNPNNIRTIDFNRAPRITWDDIFSGRLK